MSYTPISGKIQARYSAHPNKTQHSVYGLWKKKSIYEEAIRWIVDNFKHEDAHFEFSITVYTNDGHYPSTVYFRNEGDFLAFKLRFPELCVM